MASLKCGGVRETKNGYRQCTFVAKFSFCGFCSSSHKEDAQKHSTPQAFNTFTNAYQEALSTPSFGKAYNDNVRKFFYSTVCSGKAKAEAQFIQMTGVQLGNEAQKGWAEAQATLENEQAQLLNAQVTSINAHRNGFKRKQCDQSAFDKLEVDCAAPSSSGKRGKRGCVFVDDEANEAGNAGFCFAGDVSDANDEDVARANAEVEHAAQQPLPDDDEMEWDELL